MMTSEFPVAGGSFFTTVKNSAEELHAHDCFEILYLLDGTLSFVANGKELSLGVGDGLIIAPNFEHGFCESSTLFLRREILVKSDIFLSSTTHISPNGAFYNALTDKGIISFKLSSADLSFIENKLYELYSYPEEDAGHGFINMINTLISGCAAFPPKNQPNDDSEFSKKCLLLCHSYYTSSDAQNMVKKSFNYNDVYFGRKFKESFNCTLAEYINKLRMDNAVYFIINSKMPIEEICKQVGIYSIAYFIKLFKKHYGETPYKFRLSHRKKPSTKRRKNS